MRTDKIFILLYFIMNKCFIIIFLVFLYSTAWSQSETDGNLNKNDKRRYEVGSAFFENSSEKCSCDVDTAESFYSGFEKFVFAPNLPTRSINDYLDEADIKMGIDAAFFSSDESEKNSITTMENQFDQRKILNETVDEVSFKVNY